MKRKNLKLFRIEHDLTQQEMAQKCNIERSSYSLIECGLRDGRLNFWFTLQNVFNVPDSEMFSLMK